MSFLFGGRPQLSSAEKIAAAETELEMVSDMFNRSRAHSPRLPSPPSPFTNLSNTIGSQTLVTNLANQWERAG